MLRITTDNGQLPIEDYAALILVLTQKSVRDHSSFAEKLFSRSGQSTVENVLENIVQEIIQSDKSVIGVCFQT
jgi:hypothetical protein